MKKHHLFLLIICLLLVASLAFPASASKPSTTIIYPIIYEVIDLNDLPGKIVENDTLYIKKIIDQLSEKERKNISFKIFKQNTPIPVPFDDTTVWIKGRADEIAQEYYTLPLLPVGAYDFIFTIIRISGSGTPQPKVTSKYKIEVISKTNVTEAISIREGDDHT